MQCPLVRLLMYVLVWRIRSSSSVRTVGVSRLSQSAACVPCSAAASLRGARPHADVAQTTGHTDELPKTPQKQPPHRRLFSVLGIERVLGGAQGLSADGQLVLVGARNGLDVGKVVLRAHKCAGNLFDQPNRPTAQPLRSFQKAETNRPSGSSPR